MKAVAIIQARMGSTRLPKKILMKINGITILESLLSQLSDSRLLTQKIIATTTDASDDDLVRLLDSLNVDHYRGSQDDVLDRYYNCAKYCDAERIIRISGDAPFIDPRVVDKTIDYYDQSQFDYVNNFDGKNRYPVGAEVEVFSFETLETVWRHAKKPSEREHVTPYIYNNPGKFTLGHIGYARDLSHLHWTVDNPEDLEFVKMIYQKIDKKPILIEDILELLEKEPHLLNINRNIDPHEGYKKSLKDDQRRPL